MTLNFRGIPWLALALGFIVLRGLVSFGALQFFMAAQTSLCIALTLNRHNRGAVLVAVGICLNGLPVLMNGGMPVSPRAALSAGVPFPGDSSQNHLRIDADTKLPFFGDIVPFRPTAQVISVGDLVMLAGFFLGTAEAVGQARAEPSSSRQLQ